MDTNNAKFLVSHPGKQHVEKLLGVLSENFCLEKFYTLLSLDWLPGGAGFFPGKCFQTISRKKISQYPLLALKHYAFQRDLYLETYREFDNRVASDIGKHTPDVVIGYENANLKTFGAAKLASAITVLDLAAVHHSEYEKLWNKYPSYRQSLKSYGNFESMNAYKTKAYEQTDYCLCLSEYAKESLLHGGITEDRIYVVPLGVDRKLFYPDGASPTSSSTKMKLLYAGRITSLKGLPELLKVMERFDRKFDISLDIVGPTTPGESLEQIKSTNVRFHGAMSSPALRRMYQDADLFINFSYTDSWGQTVLEAMACGTPVIVTNNTGSKDAVFKGGGRVLDVGDEEQLYHQILSLYENSTLLETLASEAYRVSQHYGMEDYQYRLSATLNRIKAR